MSEELPPATPSAEENEQLAGPPLRRIHLERIGFIVAAGVLVGATFAIIIGVREGWEAAAGIFGIAWLISVWLMLGCYHLAGGMDWSETFQRDSELNEPEGFNWVLFVMEPLYFLIVLVAAFVIALVYAIVSVALSWAFAK